MYPIVNVKTRDNLILHGMLFESSDKNAIILHTHGTASNFYEEEFMTHLSEKLPIQSFSFLSFNNRGSGVLNHSWQERGSAVELFEECLVDLDAWIEYAKKRGYKKIILQGHSLGCEKVVYYMNKGKYRKKIAALILLGFADSYGIQQAYLQNFGLHDQLFQEAQSLVNQGKGHQFLTSHWNAHAGILQKSAQSFLNHFSPNSELSKTLPLRDNSTLKFYRTINIPILALISDKETAKKINNDASEWTVIPVKDACALLKKENKNTECSIIKNTDHDFLGKENELTKKIISFLQRI